MNKEVPINELGMQTLICDEVNVAGGFARKMSHRFLIGVADLLIKLPGHQAGVLEVKQRDLPKDEGHVWQLDVTPAQKNYLREAHAAGMPAGVASFTHERRSGPKLKRLRLLILPYQLIAECDWVTANEHERLDGSGEAYTIMEHLTAWIERCEREKKK